MKTAIKNRPYVRCVDVFLPAGGGVEAGGSWRAAYRRWTVGEREDGELFLSGIYSKIAKPLKNNFEK